MTFTWKKKTKYTPVAGVDKKQIPTNRSEGSNSSDYTAPSTPLSPEALLTLTLILANAKKGTSGDVEVTWSWKGFEYACLGELHRMGLITNPVGGGKDTLWLTKAGEALGKICKDILLPNVENLANILKNEKEVKKDEQNIKQH